MWDDHAWMVPRIKAALTAGLPPTATLLRDPSRKEYGVWDIKLVVALEIYEGLLVGSVPIYWDQSDRVTFNVKKRVSKSRKVIEAAQEADQNRKGFKTHGLLYYAEPRTMDGGPLPTLQEWHAEQERKQGKEKPLDR
jgi:hypothetical protein